MRSYDCRGASLLACALAAGCSGDGPKGRSDACPVGSRGCFCLPSATCDAGLGCAQGFCVPQNCALGDEGCACQLDGTCTLTNDVPLSCLGNICQNAPPSAAGTLGGACDVQTPCQTAAGQPTVCMDGVCEIPGCPSGALGCPCGAYGARVQKPGLLPRCFAGVCTVANCQPGSVGCACDPSGACLGGAICDSGLCRGDQRTLVVSTNPAVRACDLTIKGSDTGVIDSVRFLASVRGKALLGDRLVTLAFAAYTQLAPPAAIATLSSRAPARAWTLVAATCVDTEGNPVAPHGILLQ